MTSKEKSTEEEGPEVLDSEKMTSKEKATQEEGPEVLEPEKVTSKEKAIQEEGPEVIEPEKVTSKEKATQEEGPEVLEPEVLDPEVLKPEVLDPEVLKPEVLDPEVLEPEVLEPEVLDPDEDAPTEEAKKPIEEAKDPIEELQEKLNKKDMELAEQKNDFLREKADLENFRKRLVKDKADAVQFANERLLKELVQIDDNLERALNAPNVSLQILKDGVEMIQKQFTTFLKNQKVEPIEAIGKLFDPNLHEVMTQMESTEHDENIVMQEYSKGYTLNGRILCSVKVVTAKKPAKETPNPKEENVEGVESNVEGAKEKNVEGEE